MRSAKFDKVVLGELTVNLLAEPHRIVAKLKLVNSQNGRSYGSTTISTWSPEVLDKLKELRELMEASVEGIIFEDSGDSATEDLGAGVGELFGNEPPSI